MNRSLVLLFSFSFGLACTNTVSVFSEGGDGGDGGEGVGGAGGAPTTAVTTATTDVSTVATTATTTATTTSSGVGGMGGASTTTTTATSSGQTTTVATTTSTGSGGGGPCTHDFCDVGPALVDSCDPCVSQICATDPFCCNQQWDNICVSQVDTVCNIDCYPTNMGPCGTQYPNKPVCSDDNDQCALDHNSTQMSCNALCSAGGGECLGAFNDVNNQQCQVNPNEPYSCFSQQFSSVICICSQGCGNGPPCSASQDCINGSCL